MVLDIIFSPLLNLNPAVSIFVFSLIILAIINIFQKILVNQVEIKKIRDKLKELNEKIKKAQKDSNKEKTDSLFSEIMQENNRMMGMTIKPMMISLVIVIILLPWLSSTYGDMDVNLENGVGTVLIGGNNFNVVRNNNQVQVSSISCSMPCAENLGGSEWLITPVNDKIRFSRVVAFLPVGLPFLGSEVGWLGWYFLSSIPIAMLMRKLLKISI